MNAEKAIGIQMSDKRPLAAATPTPTTTAAPGTALIIVSREGRMLRLQEGQATDPLRQK